ncbi:MAG: hypothetical protein MZV65_20955 [Chromatiales bacterium]|nr:hypothetical protein [Chromatiales bacterium]
MPAGEFFTNKMQRNRDGEELPGRYPHEIHVHDQRLERMPMHVAHDRLLHKAITGLYFDDAGVEGLAFRCVQKLGVVM